MASLAAEIKTLGELQQAGVLSVDEFAAAKAALIKQFGLNYHSASTDAHGAMTPSTFKLPGIRHHLKILLQVLEEMGWTETESADWELLWAFRYPFRNQETDYVDAAKEIAAIQPPRRANHFPGMGWLCTKHILGQCLQYLRGEFGADYAISPRTFHLPKELALLEAAWETSDTRDLVDRAHSINWILKDPHHRKITGLETLEDARAADAVLAQEYVHPHLVDGHKFDMAIYVLLTSVQPLRAYVFKDSLIRICKKPYPNTTNDFFDDLESWVVNDYRPIWSLPSLETHVQGNNMEAMDSYLRSVSSKGALVWPRIFDIARKTLLGLLPTLKNSYSSHLKGHPERHGRYFEMVRMDFLLDAQLQPWLAETNMSPNLAAKNDPDGAMKHKLIESMFSLLGLNRTLPQPPVPPEFRAVPTAKERESAECKADALGREQDPSLATGVVWGDVTPSCFACPECWAGHSADELPQILQEEFHRSQNAQFGLLYPIPGSTSLSRYESADMPRCPAPIPTKKTKPKRHSSSPPSPPPTPAPLDNSQAQFDDFLAGSPRPLVWVCALVVALVLFFFLRRCLRPKKTTNKTD